MREAGAPPFGRIVVDASVLVAQLAREPDRMSARIVLGTVTDVPIAPELVLVESAYAFYKKVRDGEWSEDEHAQAIDILSRYPLDLVPIMALWRPAAALSVMLGHPVQGCVYLALARDREAVLATFDRKMARKAADIGLDVWMG